MVKNVEYEGSTESKFAQLIQDLGYNKDTDIELGTVLSPLPNIQISLDTSDLTLDKEDLIIAESLTERVIEVSIDNEKKPMRIFSPLKKGDRVLVASVNAEQVYILLDKAVT